MDPSGAKARVRGALLVAHAASALCIPVGLLAQHLFPEAGSTPVMVACLVPAGTALASFSAGLDARESGVEGPLVPSGHFSAAARHGAWAAALSALAVSLDGSDPGAATTLLRGRIAAGPFQAAYPAVMDFIAGVPVPLDMPDELYASASALAFFATIVLVVRGIAAFLLLSGRRPIRMGRRARVMPAGARPGTPALDPASHAVPATSRRS